MSVASPIFVLASSWRTGSTLVQRLLSSSPDCVIWGESQPLIRFLLEGVPRGTGQLDDFLDNGANTWMPLMSPRRYFFDQAKREMLTHLYGASASKLGRGRWGFKQVWLGGDRAQEVTSCLHRMFPQARFVLVVRHPAHAWASYKTWGHHRHRTEFLRLWKWHTEAVLSLPDVHVVRYEDFAQNGPLMIEDLQSACGVMNIDHDVLHTPITGRAADGVPDPPDRGALAAARNIAGTLYDRFGYTYSL